MEEYSRSADVKVLLHKPNFSWLIFGVLAIKLYFTIPKMLVFILILFIGVVRIMVIQGMEIKDAALKISYSFRYAIMEAEQFLSILHNQREPGLRV